MNERTHNHLEDTHPLASFRGKAVVSLDTGRKIGTVEDVLIDPGELRIEGIVTSKGGFLRSSMQAIKAEEVHLWGEDVVLVNHSDVTQKKEALPGLENCLSAYENVYDLDLISMQGDRLGQIEDLLINPHGQLVGFSVNRIRNGLADLLQHEKKDVHQLPISTLQSFGKDVLIIDLDRVRDMQPVTLPEESFTETSIEEPGFVPATGTKVDDNHEDQPRNSL